MIRSFAINNYKCFEQLTLDGCKRINVIVGDNGVGKTALLEALFWVLGTTTEFAQRFRQQRGLEGHFSGSARRIEEAIWRDYFYGSDWSRTISIQTRGDGPESRAVKIFKGVTDVSLPLGLDAQQQATGSITVEWTDSEGVKHASRPTVSSRGIDFPGTDEDRPDWFYISAGHMTPSTENASRFSDLSRAGRAEEFSKLFTGEYDWLENIGIEVIAGAPIIYATLKGTKQRLAVANASGGINRTMAILLTIASRSRAVVLVDEMENGVYHKHHLAVWKGTLALARKYESQIFVTTHSHEWLEALVKAAGNNTGDIALWRMERDENGKPALFQFDGATLKAGIERDVEVRGGAE